MQSPQLLLSSTTSFFFGGIKAAFQNARKYGFDGLEIIPYRWTRPEEILELEKQYQVKVMGIHLPQWWQKSLGEAFRAEPTLFEKLLVPLWQYALGVAKNSVGLAIARSLEERRPYLLVHSNVTEEAGGEFLPLAKTFNVVIENIPYYPKSSPTLWDPAQIKQKNQEAGLHSGVVFDPGHLRSAIKQVPGTNPIELYRQARPEIIHISYNSGGIHILPNAKEQTQLRQMLQIHKPRYIVLETNPWVSIRKGKRLLEELLESI